jgi:hypothetical protein
LRRAKREAWSGYDPTRWIQSCIPNRCLTLAGQPCSWRGQI